MVASLIYLRARTNSPACLFIIIGNFFDRSQKGTLATFPSAYFVGFFANKCKESTIHLRIFASYYVISISTVMLQFFSAMSSLQAVFEENFRSKWSLWAAVGAGCLVSP